MAAEENQAVIRRHFAALERGDLEEAASYWAPNAVNHGSGRPDQQPPPGPSGIVGVLRSLRTAFPDRRWQVDDLVAEGDKVVCRLTVSGTYGEIPPLPVEGAMLMRTPPTGKPCAVQHVHVFRVAQASGRAAEVDILGLDRLGRPSRRGLVGSCAR